MNMKKFRLLFQILMIGALLICLVACEKGKGQTTVVSGGEIVTTSPKENKITTSDYEARIYFDGDHYVLNFFTSLFTGEITIKYDNTKFVLDGAGEVFDNAVYEEEGNNCSCKVKMESNSLYEFNLIKIGNEEPVLGENIKIE